MSPRTLWLCTLLALAIPAAAQRITRPPAALKVPARHTKCVSVHGFPIVAGPSVSDYALREAAYWVDKLLAARPDARAAMVRSGTRLCILGVGEFTCDLPEFAGLGQGPDIDGVSARDWWDARARGTGGSETDPYCSVGEENLLGYPGDPYSTESILIHEFAHSLHLRGMNAVDPTFDRRVRAAYDSAMAAGLWQGKYAATNHHEYFAEGVQSWFDNNRENDHDHNHVNTRAELLAYDPGLAALCRKVFRDTKIRYTKPATRLRGHMKGYAPSKAPTFAWPPRLQAAKETIRQRARQRSDRASAGAERLAGARETTSGRLAYRTLALEGWTVHLRQDLIAASRGEVEALLPLLAEQLRRVTERVPARHVATLRTVPLWVSPPYPGVRPTAEYHPDAGWLASHGRNPAMSRGIELTDSAEFAFEVQRMPALVLHELAHAFHDQRLGFDNPEVRALYEKAKAGGRYDQVERFRGPGRGTSVERAYALTNPQEYFAEGSEAFFLRNDFAPFDRAALKSLDPALHDFLAKAWAP
jgi:hypothetical protein